MRRRPDPIGFAAHPIFICFALLAEGSGIHQTTTERTSKPSENGRTPQDTLRRILSEGVDALYRFILVRVGSDRSVAEDILQQTAFTALAHARSPEDEPDQEAWLRGIARNQIKRHWRMTRRNAEPTNGNGKIARELLATIDRRTPHGGEAPEHALYTKEMTDRLFGAVASLSREDQWLLYAYYRHDRSQSDIARELCTTSKSVESRLYRVRSRLRRMLEDLENED